MQELLLKRKHLFFLHFFTIYCESQRTHMIIFCVSQAQISAKKKTEICTENFIGHTVLPLENYLSDRANHYRKCPTAIGEHCAYHNQGWKYFAVRKDQVAIQPVNSDSQLSVDSYRGSVILPQGTATALNKDHMSCDQEVAQPKPNHVLKTLTCNNWYNKTQDFTEKWICPYVI